MIMQRICFPGATSLLPFPEHHIRIPRETHSRNPILVRNTFPFLKLDIVSRNDMGKQRLYFIDRKESSGTVRNGNGLGQRL